MTKNDTEICYDYPLRTDDQLRLALEDLLQRANLPQLWFIFLDEDDRLTGPFMPGDGYPTDPTELVETVDHGELSAAQMLATCLGMIVEVLHAASVVLVWERPGSAPLAPDTCAWVREVALACRATDVRLRAQLLLHDRGLRMLVPDDYV